MRERRVVVTGIGIVAANGVGRENYWSATRAGLSGIKAIEGFDTSPYRCHVAGEVENFILDGHQHADKASRFVIAAGKEAMADAGFRVAECADRDRMGVVVGTIHAGLLTAQKIYNLLIFGNGNKISSEQFWESRLCTPSWYIAREFNLTGPRSTVSMACASGTAAIGYGFSLIRHGKADVILAGGLDTVNEFIFSGFHSLGALSYTECRPFDRRRDGMVIGEGAGILVLEDLDHALARRAAIYAELLGYGFSSDASHISAPDSEGRGLINAIMVALAEAEVSPDDISFISSHGVGTVSSDAMECKAFAEVFKKSSQKIPISSTKPLTGHAMGASGALEAAICALAIRDNFVPGSLQSRELEPETRLNVLTSRGEEKNILTALSVSSGVGGQNAALVFSRLSVSKQNRVRKTILPKASVVVTGIGVVSPIAIGIKEYFDRLNSEARPIDSRSLEDLTAARLVKTFGDARATKLRQMDSLSHYAVLAVSLAIEEAKIDLSKVDAEQIGIVLGTAFGCIESDVKYYGELVRRNSPLMASPVTFRNTTANVAAAYVSILFGLRGVNATISSGMSSGLQAIAYSYDLLHDSRAEIIFTGDAEKIPASILNNSNGRQCLGTIKPPEGAAILTLEKRESAERRGCRIYAEVLGCGLAAGHSDKSEAVEKATTAALAEAAINLEAVQYIDQADGQSFLNEKKLQMKKRESGTYGVVRVINCLRVLQNEAELALSTTVSADGNAVSIVLKRYDR